MQTLLLFSNGSRGQYKVCFFNRNVRDSDKCLQGPFQDLNSRTLLHYNSTSNDNWTYAHDIGCILRMLHQHEVCWDPETSYWTGCDGVELWKVRQWPCLTGSVWGAGAHWDLGLFFSLGPRVCPTTRGMARPVRHVQVYVFLFVNSKFFICGVYSYMARFLDSWPIYKFFN